MVILDLQEPQDLQVLQVHQVSQDLQDNLVSTDHKDQLDLEEPLELLE